VPYRPRARRSSDKKRNVFIGNLRKVEVLRSRMVAWLPLDRITGFSGLTRFILKIL